MIRAPFCEQKYWNKWISHQEKSITEQLGQLDRPSANPKYRPQYAFTIVQKYWELMLMRYSRGDSITTLASYFPALLSAWENAERLHLELMSPEEYWHKFDISWNLDHYPVCFWLVGLALSLDIPDDQWQRLMALIGNEGKDQLLDRVIATRQPTRLIGKQVAHPKPYQRLLAVLDAPEEQRAQLLKDFVEHWYEELNRHPKNKKLSSETAIYERPFWYLYGQTNMEGGAYFGQWCIEAVAVSKAFNVDDQLCVGHPQYPGDLLKPDQVTKPDLARLPKSLRTWPAFQHTAETPPQLSDPAVQKDKGLLGRLARFWSKKS